jgi:transcriptional regulator
MSKDPSPLLQGTLDMLILKALERDAMHGFGLSVRLRELSAEVFRVETGSLYPALCRLEAKGLIRGDWNISESNRKARFYSLTSSGRKHLKAEIARWDMLSSTINTVLRTA